MTLHEILKLVKQKVYKKYKNNDISKLLVESWALSWPMIMILFFEFFMSITDVWVAGQYSKEVKAATGLANQIYFFFIIAGQALTVGAVSVISRLYNAGDKERFQSAIYTVIVSACFLGLAVSVLGLLFAPQIVHILNVPEEVGVYAISLLRVYSVGLFFHLVLVNINAVLRSCRLVKVTMKVMVSAAIINMVLNLLFLHHTNIGFVGIALSTVVSVCLAFLVNSFTIYKMINKTYKYSFKLLKNMLSIGWPGSISTLSWQLGGTALFAVIAQLPANSVEAMAAFTTGYRIESAIFMPAFAFNMANAVIVGNLIGEKKYEEAYKSGFATAFISVTVVSIMAIIIVLNARNLAIFLDPNPIVIDEVVKYLYICMISEPFIAMNMAIMGALNGAGDTRVTMIYGMANVWLIRLPSAYFFGIVMGFGSVGIWWALNAGFVLQDFLLVRRYMAKKWQNIQLDT